MTLFNLVFLLKVKPFMGKFKNTIELTNEFLTLLSCYFMQCWMYKGGNETSRESIINQQNFKCSVMTWVFMSIVGLVIIINFSI